MTDGAVNPQEAGADGTTVPDDVSSLRKANSDLHAALLDRREEIDADDRASTVFASVEELYEVYESQADDVGIATLRQVNWGFRTVEALIDDEPPPALFRIQEPDRWAYRKTLMLAASFGLIIALILWELVNGS